MHIISLNNLLEQIEKTSERTLIVLFVLEKLSISEVM